MADAKHPNLIFVFADQWRAQAAGYAGDPNASTPSLDRFASEAVNAVNAVSCCPVCSPYRASLMTGQYPLTNGIFVNDQPLLGGFVSFADALNGAGYDTAYIGKWHLHSGGRSAFIPPEHRLGFRFWRTLECTHEYNQSYYYFGDCKDKRLWRGYDAEAQTQEACRYVREERVAGKPFALFLSWGPPHDPYQTAPERFRKAGPLKLRPNVSAAAEERARHDLAGYYAHISALDSCLGTLLEQIAESGIEGETIVVFTSDHGDMLGSHGLWKKQHPFDESVCVPFLIRGPGLSPRRVTVPLNAPDLMPTLLSMCGVEIPPGVQGDDLSRALRGERSAADHAALLALYMPFHELRKPQGREYRGLRTERHTYLRDLHGPWLLFDNREDPYQTRNLAGDPSHAEILHKLDDELTKKLKSLGDEFLPGEEYFRRYRIRLNKDGDTYYE
jgi:arylsulfatase A-like enzyme